MLHRVMITSAWAYLAFIVFATLSPIAARPVIAGGVFPGAERFAAYAALGFLVYLAYPRHLTFACIVVAGSAITLELLQALRPDRHPRVLDAIEKLLGGVAGIVLAGILLSLVWPSRITPVDRLPRG